MAKIVYYVASSIDGFIAGRNDDISGFAPGGPCVEKYLSDLNEFKTVIMGRRTYEFGYQYGLKPGQKAYPHMEHHIFSNTLSFEEKDDHVHIEPISEERIVNIKDKAETDIYLCGGGVFASWLLDLKLIDQIKIKLNPIILRDGIKMFESSKTMTSLDLNNSESFDDGLKILSYDVLY